MSTREHPLNRVLKEPDAHQAWLEQMHGGSGWQRRRDDEFLAALESQYGPLM